jgi:hypothetical protein
MPTTNTTNKIPTHTPALKIPPITWHDDKVKAVAKIKSPNKEYCFMSSSFWGIMQKFCRSKLLRVYLKPRLYKPIIIPFIYFAYGLFHSLKIFALYNGSYAMVSRITERTRE